MTASLNKRYSHNWQAQALLHLRQRARHVVGRTDRRVRLRQRRRQRHRLVGSGSPSTARRASTSATRSSLNARVRAALRRRPTGFVGALIRGWQVGGVAQFSSGLPFTPFESYDQIGDRQSDTGLQKPNVNGAVTYPGTAAQWFDPSVFSTPAAGVFGNASRNSLRAPGVKVADLSLFKNLKIGHFVTQFRLEAFNAFNRVNLGLPDATIFNAGGVRNPTAGRITRTSTPARQVQLGVKLSF